MSTRMRSRSSAIAATVGMATVALVSASASTAGRGFTPEDTYLVRTAGDVQLSPDGSRLIYLIRSMDRATNRNRSQVWLTVIADGTTRRLTPADADDTSPRWSPDGKAFASLSTDAGKPAVVVTRVDDGRRRAVAPFETSSDPLAYQGVGEQLAWSPDGLRLAYLSADPGPEPAGDDPFVITRLAYKSWTGMNDNRRWHIRAVTVADGRSVQVTKGDRQEHSISWSPGGDEIAFVSNHEADPDRVHNYDIFAVKVGDGRVRTITTTAGSEYSPRWSPDGRWIAYVAGTRALTTRESNAEDTHVWVVPAAGGAGRALAASLDRRASAVQWSGDSASLYFIVEDHGSRSLYRVAADGNSLQAVIKDPGNVASFSAGANGRLAYEFASRKAPAEVFFRAASESARQITHLNQWLAERDVAVPEPFEFASFDGMRVQGFVTPPASRSANGRSPAILVIHGGPHGQQGPAFNLPAQVYAAEGYAVVMVNYRGSTGYGQKFSDGTINDQDGSEAKDVLAGLDEVLRTHAYIDPARLGIEGGSYGGQLTNWIITQTPRFKAAIASRSISNLVSLAYTHWTADYMQVEYQGYPWQRDIAARLWERSPIAHVVNVKTPTMFIHGELDEDVNIVEAEQMYNALKQLGVEAVFLRYPREGHGNREPGHIVDAMTRSVAWYARLLNGKSTTVSGGR
jgi:dipeptidyl aminopeptidase/acylaminoacyl peptidase